MNKICFSILCLIGCFSILSSAQNAGRIESEYKLAVPDTQVQDLWQYLQIAFSNTAVQAIDSSYNSSNSTEIFIDQYFDTTNEILYRHQAGVRYRKRYIQDSLIKTLVQIKLSGTDTSNVARREIKFNPYTKIKLNDRQAMHPFWRYIKPKNRDDVNLELSTFQITGDDLSPTVKVEQLRRRVYVMENGVPLMTMTLDDVTSFYFPYKKYTELELELNEIRYTEGSPVEKKQMEALNRSIKAKILSQFPDLKQDQNPKYNKMYDLLEGNILAFISEHLIEMIFAGIVAFALFLLGKEQLS